MSMSNVFVMYVIFIQNKMILMMMMMMMMVVVMMTKPNEGRPLSKKRRLRVQFFAFKLISQ